MTTRFILVRYSKDELQRIVSSSQSMFEICRKIGMAKSSGAYTSIKKRLTSDEIDFSHIPTGLGNRKGFVSRQRVTDLDQILSGSSHGRMKIQLIREGYLENKCAICDLPPIWNGKKLVLRLDHINGVRDDNKLNNLRLICPNCDSQLPTFAGRNGKNPQKCVDCGKVITRGYTRCIRCAGFASQKTKIEWPDITALEAMVKLSNYRQVGRELGVSDSAIRIHLRRHKNKLK